jgi:hypothetical protein
MLYGCSYGRGTGPGTAAHWEAQPPVVAQGAAAALRTRPLPQPTASSLVVDSFFLAARLDPRCKHPLQEVLLSAPKPANAIYAVNTP